MTTQTAALFLLAGATLLTGYCLIVHRTTATEARLACWGALTLCGCALALAAAPFLR